MNDKTKLLLGMLICSWIFCSWLLLRSNKLERDNDRLSNNVASLNNTLQDETITYQTTLSSLQMTNDSLTKIIAKNVDKKTKQVVYVKSIEHVTDTVQLPPERITIHQQIDTVLTDGEWYRLNITIDTLYRLSTAFITQSELTYQLTSEKVIPEPRRWWIQRLFQHKVKVHRVKLYERNPYIKHETLRAIEIID